MSQVRKLLKGQNMPKAQDGYKFRLDSQDIYLTDKDLADIDEIMYSYPIQERQFVNTSAIKSGEERGDRSNNTMTMNMFRGLNEKNTNRLSKQSGSFWESFLPTDSYWAKVGANHLLDAIHTVYNNNHNSSNIKNKPEKKRVTSEIIPLEFNEVNGKKTLSTVGNYDARKRISDLIANLQAGDNSEYDYSGYDINSIQSWLNSLEGDDKYAAGNAYFDNLWTAMGNADYKYDPEVEKLLDLFGIKYGVTAPNSQDSTTLKLDDDKPQIEGDTNPTASKNDNLTKDGDGKTSITLPNDLNPNLPTLITPEIAELNNMDSSYVYGLIYNGVPYRETDKEMPERLFKIMQNVRQINEENNSLSDRYLKLSKLINIPSAKQYADWKTGMSLPGLNVGSELENRGLSSVGITEMLELPKGVRGFKYFNNSKPGENQLGFRSPQYLWFNNGELYNGSDISNMYSKPNFELMWAPRNFPITFEASKTVGVTNYPARTGNIFGSMRGSFEVNGQKYNIIKDIDGEYHIISKIGGYVGRNKTVSEEFVNKALSGKVSKSEMRSLGFYKEGGTISKPKIISFKSKFNKGDIIKAQTGLKFNIPEDLKPTDVDIDWNTIAYRPNLDWGTYINGVYTPRGDISPAPMLYPTKNAQYMAAKNALIEAYGKYSTPDLSNYGYKEVYQIPVEETEPTVGKTTVLPSLNDDWHTPTYDDAKVAIAEAIKNKPIQKVSTTVTPSVASDQDMGGGPTNPISDKTKWLIPGISALGAISNLIQSKKYADEEKAKINDGRYSLQSQPIDLMAYYNPIFERRRQEINQRRMSGLLGSPTSDWTAYNAGLNQLQSQLDAQLGELTTQEAQDKFTRDQTNVQLRNQKFALDTNTANENARMDAYLDMASHDPKLAQMMRNWQTKENFRMQMLNMINKDINTIYGYKQNKFNMNQSREFDSWLRSNYADAVKAYSELDYSQRMQYADLEDYIERTDPNAVEAIRVKKQLMQEQYLDWLRRNGTTFNYNWLSGRTSPETDAYKKGGTLRGKTRYTMEPDERIWVDNNKAAHAAVAKLSENTIKMLLKALK